MTVTGWGVDLSYFDSLQYFCWVVEPPKWMFDVFVEGFSVHTFVEEFQMKITDKCSDFCQTSLGTIHA